MSISPISHPLSRWVELTDQCQAGVKTKKTGALLFAVVGGKLSEGESFTTRFISPISSSWCSTTYEQGYVTDADTIRDQLFR